MPALLISQMFSRQSLRKVSGNYVIRESWQVVGTPDKNLAMESAISFAAPHSSNPYLCCSHRDATNHKGPLSWIVTAEFTFGDAGRGSEFGPLGEAARIMGEPVIESEPADVDIDGNPICNSAGDPYDPPFPTYRHAFSLIVRKALPFYSVQLALQYTNAANSDAFILTGAGGVDPGQCLCRSIRPAEDYSSSPTALHPYVWHEYSFLFRELNDPFQLHPIDMGRRGFYTGADSKPHKGEICYNDGTPVSSDVRLNGQGKPLDPDLKIVDRSGKTYSPIVNPTFPNGILIDNLRSNAFQKTLFWKNRNAQPFSGLI